MEVGFAQDMSVHHRQAALMAGIARERSTDPAVRSLAFDIETSQLEQIGRMQGWLRLQTCNGFDESAVSRSTCSSCS